MINLEDLKAAFNEQGNEFAVSNVEKEEAIKRMKRANLIHVPRYSLVVLDRKELLGDGFDMANHYKYSCLTKDFGGTRDVDNLTNAPMFSDIEVPNQLRKFMVDIPHLNTQLDVDDVERALEGQIIETGIGWREKKSLINRLVNAGLAKSKVKLYNIMIDPKDDESYVNLFRNDPTKIRMADIGETPSLQTIFTQGDIDKTPILKAMEQYKVEYKGVHND